MNIPIRVTLLALTALAVACGGSKSPSDKDDDNTCQPSCTGATCGQSDGCGGTCAGTCEGDLVCSADKKCEAQCVPSCSSAACGDADGCGGTCFGTCSDGLSCDAVSKTCKASGACPFPSSLGALGALAGDSEGDEFFVDFYAPIDSGADTSSLYLSLEDGYGVYENGLKTGQVSLTGDETNMATCGACLQLYASTSAEEGMFFMPTGGTLNVSSINGRFTGTVSNVTFVEVTIDEETWESTPVPNGCTTQVTSASFDAEIVPYE